MLLDLLPKLEIDLPAYVKAAETADTVKPASLPATAYADPLTRLLPCHTPAATWCSAMLYEHEPSHWPESARGAVKAALERFSAYWGVSGDVLRAKEALQVKQAAQPPDEADYALVRQFTDGTTEYGLPVRDADEVKGAADWLCEHAGELPFSDRNAAARRILAKSAQFSEPLPDRQVFLQRQAGLGAFDPEKVATMIHGRRHLTSDASHQAALANLADTVRAKAAFFAPPDARIKLANMVDQFDRAVGLVNHYSDSFRRPEDVIFEVTPAEAVKLAATLVEAPNGKIYAKDDLTKIAAADLQEAFGDSFVRDVMRPLGGQVDAEKIAARIATLPRTDCDLLDDLLAKQGAEAVQDRSTPVRISDDDWNGLAAMYGRPACGAGA